jgi:predicted acetyltransferase
MELERNKTYVEWLQQQAHRYAGQISMVLLYGSYVNQTSTSVSDVDCYFIPKTQEGRTMAQTAIIEGIGYDLFPLSWDRVKGISEFRSPLTPLLGNVKVLYADTVEDLTHFQHLQQELQNRLSDYDYMHRIALESLSEAASMISRLMQIDTIGLQRRWAGNAIIALANAVAYENQTYFTRGLKKQREDLEKLDKRPARFLQRYDAVLRATDPEALKKDGLLLLWETAEFLQYQDEPALPYIPTRMRPCPKPFTGCELASWYEEGVSAFSKIYYATEVGDLFLAFISAVCLESTLAEDLCQEFGWPEFDLMSAYDPIDLKKLAVRTSKVQTHLLRLLEEDQTPLRNYVSMQDFIQAQNIALPHNIEPHDTSSLTDGEIRLRLESQSPYDSSRGYVPTYYFHITRESDDQIIGRCDLRIGYNANIEIGGNMGYTIFEPYRGHHYATKACRLMLPLAKSHDLTRLLITMRPDNEPSRRTCLALGATLQREIVLPPDHELARSSRTLLQFELNL